jgi:hypothetical protein
VDKGKAALILDDFTTDCIQKVVNTLSELMQTIERA